jgi:DNA-binding NarL/FixJ family response regulator
MLPRLLLADDHQMLRQGLRRSMEDEGFEVVGEAGDGVEATRQIRAALHQVRIIMLTMHADKDVIRRAIDAGASGYLVKDCSIDEVVAVVRQVASGQIADLRHRDHRREPPPDRSTNASSPPGRWSCSS